MDRLVGDAGLVAPVDHRPFGFGAGRNLRVVLGQPGLDRGILPFQRALDRPLRGEAPAAQVIAHGPQREPHPEAGLGQVAHRLATPERERQLELVRGVFGHQPLHLGGLAGVEQPLGLVTAATLFGLEGSGAGNPPAFQPAIDRVLVQAEGGGDRQLRVAGLVHRHGALAQHLQRRIRDRSTITLLHRFHVAEPPSLVTLFRRRISIDMDRPPTERTYKEPVGWINKPAANGEGGFIAIRTTAIGW